MHWQRQSSFHIKTGTRNKIYDSLPKTAPEHVVIVQTHPKLRITPPMQAEILRLYMQGCSLTEIARRTHRARQTVTKVVRAPDMQARLQKDKETLLAECADWAESINYAVTHELDARLAFKLCARFNVIPSPEKNVPAEPQNNQEPVDPRRLATIKVLEQIAIERGSSAQFEDDALEELVRKD